MDSNNSIFELDLNSGSWSKFDLDPESAVPEARDDHSYYYDKESASLYIFGGYVGGGKSNDLWKLSMTDKKWTMIMDNEEE